MTSKESRVFLPLINHLKDPGTSSAHISNKIQSLHKIRSLLTKSDVNLKLFKQLNGFSYILSILTTQCLESGQSLSSASMAAKLTNVALSILATSAMNKDVRKEFVEKRDVISQVYAVFLSVAGNVRDPIHARVFRLIANICCTPQYVHHVQKCAFLKPMVNVLSRTESQDIIVTGVRALKYMWLSNDSLIQDDIRTSAGVQFILDNLLTLTDPSAVHTRLLIVLSMLSSNGKTFTLDMRTLHCEFIVTHLQHPLTCETVIEILFKLSTFDVTVNARNRYELGNTCLVSKIVQFIYPLNSNKKTHQLIRLLCILCHKNIFMREKLLDTPNCMSTLLLYLQEDNIERLPNTEAQILQQKEECSMDVDEEIVKKNNSEVDVQDVKEANNKTDIQDVNKASNKTDIQNANEPNNEIGIADVNKSNSETDIQDVNEASNKTDIQELNEASNKTDTLDGKEAENKTDIQNANETNNEMDTQEGKEGRNKTDDQDIKKPNNKIEIQNLKEVYKDQFCEGRSKKSFSKGSNFTNNIHYHILQCLDYYQYDTRKIIQLVSENVIGVLMTRLREEILKHECRHYAPVYEQTKVEHMQQGAVSPYSPTYSGYSSFSMSPNRSPSWNPCTSPASSSADVADSDDDMSVYSPLMMNCEEEEEEDGTGDLSSNEQDVDLDEDNIDDNGSTLSSLEKTNTKLDLLIIRILLHILYTKVNASCPYVDLFSCQTIWSTLIDYILKVSNEDGRRNVSKILFTVVRKRSLLRKLLNDNFVLVVHRKLCRLRHGANCVHCNTIMSYGQEILNEMAIETNSSYGYEEIMNEYRKQRSRKEISVGADEDSSGLLHFMIPYLLKHHPKLHRTLFCERTLDAILDELDGEQQEEAVMAIRELFGAIYSDKREPSRLSCRGCEKVTYEGDITFLLDDNSTINANKEMLINQSVYFETMLCGNFKECDQKSNIKLSNISSSCLSCLLKLIYNNCCACLFPQNDVNVYLELIVKTDEYLMHKLNHKLINGLYASNVVNHSNVHLVYEWGLVHNEFLQGCARNYEFIFKRNEDYPRIKRLKIDDSKEITGVSEKHSEDRKIELKSLEQTDQVVSLSDERDLSRSSVVGSEASQNDRLVETVEDEANQKSRLVETIRSEDSQNEENFITDKDEPGQNKRLVETLSGEASQSDRLVETNNIVPVDNEEEETDLIAKIINGSNRRSTKVCSNVRNVSSERSSGLERKSQMKDVLLKDSAVMKRMLGQKMKKKWNSFNKGDQLYEDVDVFAIKIVFSVSNALTYRQHVEMVRNVIVLGERNEGLFEQFKLDVKQFINDNLT